MPAQRPFPTKSGRSRKPRKLPVYLTKRERAVLLKAAAESSPRGVPNGALRDRAIIAIGCFAGLRVSEISHLDRPDVDLDELTIRVREGKGGKDRELPLHIEAAIALEDYLATRSDAEPAIFLSRRGSRLSPRALREVVYRLARDAALAKRISPHKLRHSFATLFLDDNPEDIRTLQELMGHASIATTEIYTAVSQGRKRRSVDRMT